MQDFLLILLLLLAGALALRACFRKHKHGCGCCGGGCCGKEHADEHRSCPCRDRRD